MANHYVLIKTPFITEYAIEVTSEDRHATVYISETGNIYQPDQDRHDFGKVMTLKEDIKERAKYLEALCDALPCRRSTGKPTPIKINEVSDKSDCPDTLLISLRDDYLHGIETYTPKAKETIEYFQDEYKKITKALCEHKISIQENCTGNIHYIDQILSNESPLLKQTDFLTEFVHNLPKNFYQTIFPNVPEQLNENENVYCTPFEINNREIKIQRFIYLLNYPEDMLLSEKAMEDCKEKFPLAIMNHPYYKDDIARDTIEIEDTIEVQDEIPDCDYIHTSFNPYEEPSTHKVTVVTGEQYIGILYRQAIEIPYEGRLTKEYAKELADKFTNEILALTPSLENNSGDEIED